MANVSKFDGDTAEGMVDTSGDNLPRGKRGRPDKSRVKSGADTRKITGAGPAIAERSKDAKAIKGGRQPGAYVKEE